MIYGVSNNTEVAKFFQIIQNKTNTIFSTHEYHYYRHQGRPIRKFDLPSQYFKMKLLTIEML